MDFDRGYLRGIVEIDPMSKEAEIREKIGNCLRLKYRIVTNSDFQFLRATRRKLSKPVNCGGFDFKQIKILAGQGSIYLKLKDWLYCMINEDHNSDDDEAGKIALNIIAKISFHWPVISQTLPEACPFLAIFNKSNRKYYLLFIFEKF